MKIKIFHCAFLLMLLISQNIKAQCDIATNGLVLSNSPIATGSTAQFKFDVYNGGTDEACVYAIGTVKVELILPAGSIYQFDSFVSPAGSTSALGPFFNWTYDATNHKVVGVNHTPIAYLDGEASVTVAVKGVSSGSATTTLQLTALNGATNTTTLNDSAPATLVVSSTLPVRLLDFEGKVQAGGNLLSWHTTSETNFSHFELERSVNASSFEKINRISGGRDAYSYIDKTPSPIGNYYRLVMVDNDGTITMSKVIFLKSDNNLNAIVGDFYPNPAHYGSTNINITVQKASLWTITTVDTQGKILTATKVPLKEGQNAVKLDIPETSNGLIYYKFQSMEGIFIRKVLVP